MGDVVDIRGDGGVETVDVDRRDRARHKRQLGQDSADVRQSRPVLPLMGGLVVLETAEAACQRHHAPTAIVIPPHVEQVVAGPTGAEVSPGVLGALVPARSRVLRVGVIGGVVVAGRDGRGTGVKRGRGVE